MDFIEAYICPSCKVEDATFTVTDLGSTGILLTCDNCGNELFIEGTDSLSGENRRTMAERRRRSHFAAVRRRKIAENVFGFSYYNNLHQYSKNKIHCSCPLCASKTNSKKLHGRSNNWKPSDLRKLEQARSQIEDYMTEKDMAVDF